MANGDRFFGPNGASGAVTGTGAAISVVLDFAPQWVELVNSVTGASMYWTKGMPDASGLVGGAAGGGGNTGPTTAVNNPSAVSAPTIGLAALAPHSHTMAPTVNEAVVVTPGTGVSAALAGIPVGYVVNVYQTAGGVTGPATIIPSTATLATQQVQIDYTTGILTFLVADAVTQATVTYSSINTSNTSGGTPTVTSVSAQTAAAQVQDPHTHTVPAGGGATFVVVGGVTPGSQGFIIGTDASINILGDNIYWNAGR